MNTGPTFRQFATKRRNYREAGGVLLRALVVLLIAVGLVWFFFLRVYRVTQNGMAPALTQDSMLVGRQFPYGNVAAVERGDIVVLKHPIYGEEMNLIWRVIGLPGDSIEMDGDNVWINGKRLPHEQVRYDGDVVTYQETNGRAIYSVLYDRSSSHPGLPLKVKVPPSKIFVLGDNRYHALDSTHLGPISFEKIIAKRLW